MLWGTELAVLAGSGQLAQHILVEIALHIQVGNVMLIQVVQPGNDFLQHLGCRDQEHGIAHVPGKGGVPLICFPRLFGNLKQIALLIKIRQLSVFQILDGRKDPLGNDRKNVSGVAVLELAPPHGLPSGRLGEDLVHFLPGHVLKFLRFQLFFVQRADEHQIGQLLDDGQGVRDAARPDVRPDFVDFVFNDACDHSIILRISFVPLIIASALMPTQSTGLPGPP